MAIALVAHYREGSVGGGAFTTSALDTTGANFVAVYVSENSAGAVTSVADNKGNTYTPLTDQFTGAPGGRLFYAKNATCGTGHTWTINGSGTFYPNACIAAFSGVDTSAPADQENGQSSAGYAATTIQPGSITPSVNGCLVLTGIAAQDNTSPSINGTYTITDTAVTSSGNYWGAGLAYDIQTTATATNPTWTSSGNWNNVGLSIESFKPSTAPLLNIGTSLKKVTAAINVIEPYTTNSPRLNAYFEHFWGGRS